MEYTIASHPVIDVSENSGYTGEMANYQWHRWKIGKRPITERPDARRISPLSKVLDYNASSTKDLIGPFEVPQFRSVADNGHDWMQVGRGFSNFESGIDSNFVFQLSFALHQIEFLLSNYTI